MKHFDKEKFVLDSDSNDDGNATKTDTVTNGADFGSKQIQSLTCSFICPGYCASNPNTCNKGIFSLQTLY